MRALTAGQASIGGPQWTTVTRISSEELAEVLIQHGGRCVARHDHGTFMKMGKRLIFLRHTSDIGAHAILDILRMTAIHAAELHGWLLDHRAAGSPGQRDGLLALR